MRYIHVLFGSGILSFERIEHISDKLGTSFLPFLAVCVAFCFLRSIPDRDICHYPSLPLPLASCAPVVLVRSPAWWRHMSGVSEKVISPFIRSYWQLYFVRVERSWNRPTPRPRNNILYHLITVARRDLLNDH